MALPDITTRHVTCPRHPHPGIHNLTQLRLSHPDGCMQQKGDLVCTHGGQGQQVLAEGSDHAAQHGRWCI